MRIPEVREELEQIANDLEVVVRSLDRLCKELRRRKGKRGAVTSNPVTPEVEKEVRKMTRLGYSQQEIARHLKINSGRVSEILRGKRK